MGVGFRDIVFASDQNFRGMSVCMSVFDKNLVVLSLLLTGILQIYLLVTEILEVYLIVTGIF